MPQQCYQTIFLQSTVCRVSIFLLRLLKTVQLGLNQANMQADTSACSHHIRFSSSTGPFHCFCLEFKMNTVSREEACCIFFCKKFNEENVKICTERVEKWWKLKFATEVIQLNQSLFVKHEYLVPQVYSTYKSKEEIEKNHEEIEKNKDGKEDILFCK
ncbi:hypothetical protein BCV72DRAFT_86569, partial [Rhizopus microsporus var. microsporus]